MKINTDINTRVQGYSTRVTDSAATPSAAASQQKTAQNVSTRDMSNALMIMQKAQVIVQRALTASHRLQNMAMGTITNNPSAYEQIGQELRSVNASLSEYSVPVTAPPAAQQIASRELPELKNNINALSEIAQNQAEGKTQRTELDNISRNLGEQALRIESANSQIIGRQTVSDMPIAKTITDTADLIGSNPKAAIAAQGYVQPERVSRLI
ncbi:MAG: hypothetical protein JXK07_16405 [Spirochaetes bacterium]|nr:hypothetical protein [Spirochaetota bacterium]MBN2771167.1 hypothetical protein [Spirochaetota bacterium]